MKQQQQSLTVAIAAYSATVEEICHAIDLYKEYFSGTSWQVNYLVIQNGDVSPFPQDSFSSDVEHVYTRNKGMGYAHKLGVGKASGEYYYTSPVDVPFGFSDLDRMLPLATSYDLIVGSKLHPDSVYSIHLSRKVMSLLRTIMIRLLFPAFPVRDPDGTHFARTEIYGQLLKKVNSTDFFILSELVFRSYHDKIRLFEVPVVYRSKTKKTTVSMFDVISYTWQLIKITVRLRFPNTR